MQNQNYNPMKIEKVSYGKTFPLGNYSSERIDVEASIDETDNIAQVFDMLKGICDGQHKINNPHLYQETTPTDNTSFTTTPDPSIPFTYTDNQQKTPKSRDEIYLNEIHNCKTIQDLDAWKFLAKSKPVLENAYNDKLNELTNVKH